MKFSLVSDSTSCSSASWNFVRFVFVLLLVCAASHDEGGRGQCVSPFRWIPEATHPCTIARMTMMEFLSKFGPEGVPIFHPDPFIIIGDEGITSNDRFRELTTVQKILDSFPPDFVVTLSSSNSFSEHRRSVSLKKYLQEVLEGEILPSQLSNETWYLFGETYSGDWMRLLNNYEVPKCKACDREMVALSFGIGGRGSGVQWHVHGPGFSETIHGRKHWVLSKEKPAFHPDQTSRNWMEYNFTTLVPETRPLQCTLSPGDLLYFPDMWWHATINLDSYTSFVSTFTQDHLFSRNTILH